MTTSKTNENIKITSIPRIIRRRLFGPDDDNLFLTIMKNQSFIDWNTIAKQMPGFNARQCRDRWHNYLSPKNSFQPWTLEEDLKIIQKVQEHGTRWSLISSYLPGRSDNLVKNRWNVVLKYVVNHKFELEVFENMEEYAKKKQNDIKTNGIIINFNNFIQTDNNHNLSLEPRFVKTFFE